MHQRKYITKNFSLNKNTQQKAHKFVSLYLDEIDCNCHHEGKSVMNTVWVVWRQSQNQV